MYHDYCCGEGDLYQILVTCLYFIVQTEPEKFQGQTLEEQLNTCKDSEPALGELFCSML